MSLILDTLKSKRRLLTGEGVPDSMIGEAEKMLGLSFSDEYREYLREYGIAAYSGHELTGITRSPRLNVVSVTLAERERNEDAPRNLYVVERTNVEEILVWQGDSGELYYSSPNHPLEKFCNSLSEYIRGKTSNEV